MAVRLLFILMILGSSLCAQEMLITYYSKCDALSFKFGVQKSDTIYTTVVNPDSLAAGHVNYYYVPYTKYFVHPEDLSYFPSGEVTVNIDSLMADPDTSIDILLRVYPSIYAVDYYAVIDSIIYIHNEDLVTTYQMNYSTDTNYVTILKLCDTCSNTSYNCTSGDCVSQGWTVIADSVLDNNYQLGLRSSNVVYLYVELRNKYSAAISWTYLVIVPNKYKKMIRHNNKIMCSGTKIYTTVRHTIYSYTCAFTR